MTVAFTLVPKLHLGTQLSAQLRCFLLGRRKAASCALRAPGQQVVRATRTSLFFWSPSCELASNPTDIVRDFANTIQEVEEIGDHTVTSAFAGPSGKISPSTFRSPIR